MNNNQQLLSSLLRCTQLGQVGIRSVLDTSMCANLRQSLESQLREFDAIETEAHTLAHQRGWELPELDPALRFFSDRITRWQITGRNSDSRIADLMIQRNTKSMNRTLRQLHQTDGQDQKARVLSQKLLDCASAGIRQMQHYL